MRSRRLGGAVLAVGLATVGLATVGPGLAPARVAPHPTPDASALTLSAPVSLAAPNDASGFVRRIGWTYRSVAPGVTLASGSYADPSAHPYWTVTLQAPTTSPFDGSAEEAEAGSPDWARRTVAALRADALAPTAQLLDWPVYRDDPRGPMAIRVRVGDFTTEAQAAAEAANLTADGFAPEVEWTGDDAQPGPDAELLHAAIVDPSRFAGRVIATHGSAIAARQTVPAVSAELGSLAGTNGGFFTIDTSLAAVDGVQTGLGVYGGEIESLANGDRAALILDGRRPARIENLRSVASVRAGVSTVRILGVNRVPGSAEDCGVPGFQPTSGSRQGPVCTGADDLVLFTPQFGAPLPAAAGSGPSAQVVLGPDGTVVSAGAPGGELPAGDSALEGIGTAAAWLTTHAAVGTRLVISEQITTALEDPIHLDPQTSIASAGPMLLRDGRPDIDAVDEGVLDPRDLDDYTFSAYRHARTMVGIDARGDLILVTADGIPGVSEGLSLTEEARLMRSLGAVDAMNLDGGGSTEFASAGQLVNDASSDPLRPVGDSIQIVPAAP